MSDHHIQLWTLIVQSAAFAGLIWYCVETFRLRKASQQQIEISDKVMTSATDQVESLSKPCLTFASQQRDPTEAVLGPLGNTIAISDAGNFVLENIGNGPALNVNYEFRATGETARLFTPRGVRYVQNVLSAHRLRMVEPQTAYNGLFEVIFHYESIGGRRYESRVSMESYVLTSFRFSEIRL